MRRSKYHNMGILSPIEVSIVEELAKDGASRAEIGKRLQYSTEAIRWYFSDIFAFVGCTNRTELALWWIRTGRYKQQSLNVDGTNSTDGFINEWSRR